MSIKRLDRKINIPLVILFDPADTSNLGCGYTKCIIIYGNPKEIEDYIHTRFGLATNRHPMNSKGPMRYYHIQRVVGLPPLFSYKNRVDLYVKHYNAKVFNQFDEGFKDYLEQNFHNKS